MYIFNKSKSNSVGLSVCLLIISLTSLTGCGMKYYAYGSGTGPFGRGAVYLTEKSMKLGSNICEKTGSTDENRQASVKVSEKNGVTHTTATSQADCSPNNDKTENKAH